MDAGLYLVPLETAESAPERREGDRMNPAPLDLGYQLRQPRLDVREAAAGAPVPLGRKVDDETRDQFPGFEHEPPARLQFAAVAGILVRLVVVREPALERQRDAAAHNADAVDTVHQRLAVRRQ